MEIRVFNKSLLKFFLLSILTILFFVPIAYTEPIDIQIGVPINDTLINTGTIKQYKIAITGNESLMLFFWCSDRGDYYNIKVHYGSITGEEVGTRWGEQTLPDLSIEIESPKTGDYYIEVSNIYNSAHNFKLLAERRSLQSYEIGQEIKDQELLSVGDFRQYKFTVLSSEDLMIFFSGTPVEYYYDIKLHYGSLTGEEVGVKWKSGDLTIEVDTPKSGDYYLVIRSISYGNRSFKINSGTRTLQTISIGEEINNQMLVTVGDFHQYKLTVTGTDPLLLFFWSSEIGYCDVKIHFGNINGEEVGTKWGTTIIIDTPKSGDYYIVVRSSFAGSRSYKLLAKRRTLQTFIIGEEVKDQEFINEGDFYNYKFTLTGGETLMLFFWFSGLTDDYIIKVCYGSINGEEVGIRWGYSTFQELTIEVDTPKAGDYYMEVRSKYGGIRNFKFLTERRNIQTISIEQEVKDQGLVIFGDYRSYKFTVSNDKVLMIFFSGTPVEYYYDIKLHYGSLTGEEVGVKWKSGDMTIEVDTPKFGDYYLVIRSISLGSRTFQLNIKQARQLTLEQKLENQSFTSSGMLYQIKTDLSTPLLFSLDKSDIWNCSMKIKRNSFPNEGPYWSDAGYGNLEFGLINSAPGLYLIYISGDPFSGKYSVLATSEVNNAKKALSVDNEIMCAKILKDRGCVSSIVFKGGSNRELINPQWEHYLIDFGSDPHLGNYLKKDWKIKNVNIQTNYVGLMFQHPSGFSNELTISWEQNRIELRYNLNVPEPFETYPNFIPGGAGEVSEDKWAVPVDNQVQVGDFTYPGGDSKPIFPSDGSWISPSEGWIALWDDLIDEVYGFTFSGGYKVKIWNGAAADPMILFPAGTSRISFYIVKSKPPIVYQAIKNLTSGSYLTLKNNPDKLFASAGNEISYSLAFKNTGNATAVNVGIKSIISPFLEIIPGSISNSGIYSSETNSIRWAKDSIGINELEDTVTFNARVLQSTPNKQNLECRGSIWSRDEPIATIANAYTTIANPVISNVSPEKGGNNGNVTIVIKGENLDPNAQVKLIGANDQDIAASIISGMQDGTQLSATFNLAEKPLGTYDVVVINPGKSSVTQKNAFIVEAGGEAKLLIEIIGRNQVRVGRKESFKIQLENTGNLDSYYLLKITIPQESITKIQNFLFHQTKQQNKNYLSYELKNKCIQIANNLIYAGLLPANQLSDPLLVNLKIDQLINPIILKVELESLNQSNIPLPIPIPTPGPYDPLIGWVYPHVVKVFKENGVKIDEDAYSLWNVLGKAIINSFKPSGHGNITSTSEISNSTTRYVINNAAELHITFPDPGKFLKEKPDEINSELIANYKSEIVKADSIRMVTSFDPNDKLNLSGFDYEGIVPEQKKHFLQPGILMPYVINFENLETATAATQEILITDTLSSSLDWPTFSLNEINVGDKTLTIAEGNKNYSGTIDLRPSVSSLVDLECTFNSSNGIVTWLLNGRDPYTGELADILPPNKSDVAPKGQGYVSYSVRPKQNLATGTIIKNRATIDFEVGIPPAPMNTPEVFNTIDTDIPQSKVVSAVLDSGKYLLKWTGSDVGSGIHDYSIYISENGGPFTSWFSNIKDTSGKFEFNSNSEYRIYSIANDNVGNSEAPPDSFDIKIKTIDGNVETYNLPLNFSLSQNYPNPFNSSTTINYEIPSQCHISIKLYNILGQEIETLVNEEQKAGRRKVTWFASRFSSGVYFYRIHAGSFIETKKLVLIK